MVMVAAPLEATPAIPFHTRSPLLAASCASADTWPGFQRANQRRVAAPEGGGLAGEQGTKEGARFVDLALILPGYLIISFFYYYF